jgi:GNAT superfamily N-acetyltransferase
MNIRHNTLAQSLQPVVRHAAPPVYRPSAHHQGVQPKSANNFRLEARPAPAVYRPQPPSIPSQPKMQAASLQPQAQYELSPPVWIGNGRQQIRVKTKGSPTPIGSVDVHFNEPGKAFISDLEVAQAHRQHGLGSMLVKAALDSARRQGSMATELEANPSAGSISKQGLVSMYQKLGFRSTGFTRRGNPRMSTR